MLLLGEIVKVAAEERLLFSRLRPCSMIFLASISGFFSSILAMEDVGEVQSEFNDVFERFSGQSRCFWLCSLGRFLIWVLTCSALLPPFPPPPLIDAEAEVEDELRGPFPEEEHLVNVTSVSLFINGATFGSGVELLAAEAGGRPFPAAAVPLTVTSISRLTRSLTADWLRSGRSLNTFSVSSFSLAATILACSSSSCFISVSKVFLLCSRSLRLEAISMAFSMNSPEFLAWMPSSFSLSLSKSNESVMRVSICCFSCFFRFSRSSLTFSSSRV